jgi:hypothetical protein
MFCAACALGKKPGHDIPLFSFDDFGLGEMLTPGFRWCASRLAAFLSRHPLLRHVEQ